MKPVLPVIFSLLISLNLFADEAFTDLGKEGNNLVLREFEAYRARFPQGQCPKQTTGRRVLVTGFGLFAGAPYNISGSVVKFMRQNAESFTEIGGESVSLCFLDFDVKWDLAAAILVYESRFFKPDLVLMTGRGREDVSLEAGAINVALKLPGYLPDGTSLDELNIPHSDWLLEDYPVRSDLAMNWNTKAVADKISPLVAKLGYSVRPRTRARWDNDYICNNLSFIMLHAAKNRPVRLAGGLVQVESPEFEREPIVGFFHFPAVDIRNRRLSTEALWAWSGVLVNVVEQTLP